jgi:hypothetical protein
MNPLEWKREHQIALVGAIIVGFALGLAFGYARDTHFSGFGEWLITALNPNYPGTTGTGWSIFGALIGAAIAYVVQLMRR